MAFTRGHLYYILRNRIYVGDVTHKGIAYPGLHLPIIERATFEAVQQGLLDNAPHRRSTGNAKARSLLTGLVFDETADRLCPTHANKTGRRYRYYISKRLMHRTGHLVDGWRLPALELERVCLDALKAFLLDKCRVIDALPKEGLSAHRLKAILSRASVLAADIATMSARQQQGMLRGLLHRIVINSKSLRLDVNRTGLYRRLSDECINTAETHTDPYEFYTAVNLRRRGVEVKLVLDSKTGAAQSPDEKLVNLLARAHCWHDQVTQGQVRSVKQLAFDVNLNAADVGRTLQLAYLAPDITDAILTGRHPVELTPRRLMRIGVLPFAWDDQRKALGFPQTS
jgi:hypothetical protein